MVVHEYLQSLGLERIALEKLRRDHQELLDKVAALEAEVQSLREVF